MYNRSTASGENTGTASVILSVGAGDKFRIRVARLAGTDTIRTIADGSGLMIVDLAGGNTGPSGTSGTSGGAMTVSGASPSQQFQAVPDDTGLGPYGWVRVTLGGTNYFLPAWITE